MQIKSMMLLIAILSLTTACQTASVGDFCGVYNPVYTSFDDSITEQTQRSINKNNAVYACKCLEEKEFCK